MLGYFTKLIQQQILTASNETEDNHE